MSIVKCSKFGKEFSEVWPAPSSKIQWSDFDRKLLDKSCVDVPPRNPLKLSELIENSNKFGVKFPISTCRIIEQPTARKELIEKFAGTAYPIIHERVLWLYCQFLEHKLKYGSTIEKEIYKNMTIIAFVQRLLEKRCASFIGANDKYLLISGAKGASGFAEIGTDNEKYPLILKNCLSYDEIKLSALLSVSSYTEFINSGYRTNCGEVEKNKSLIEQDGVVIGIIGARLSRRDFMEFQDIVVSKTQNTSQNGYGQSGQFIVTDESKKKYEFRQVWSKFYEEPNKLFTKVAEEVKLKSPRYGPSKNKNDFFDNLIMKKRYTMSFDTLLLECEARGKNAGKNVYVHVVGIGLGVWKACQHQEEIFLETFEQRVKYLIKKLPHITHLHFSWFKLDAYGEIRNGNILKSNEHPNGGIKIFISKRNPADKLNLENTLLVVSYAWDGNALPGNEFWMGMLKSTGDSSTACSTLITELHNVHINQPMVNGANLHIACEKNGVVHVCDYVKSLTKKK